MDRINKTYVKPFPTENDKNTTRILGAIKLNV